MSLIEEELLVALNESKDANVAVAKNLGQINQTLLRMSTLLEKLIDPADKRDSAEVEPEKNVDEEYLEKIVQMYEEEARHKALNSHQRKSSKRIQENIQTITVDFLQEKLGSDYEVKAYEDAYVVIYRGVDVGITKALAMLRVVNDLGYMRSADNLQKLALKPMIKKASQIGIQKDNTFLVVLTLANSLHQGDIRRVLNQPGLSNKALFKISNTSAQATIEQYLMDDESMLGLSNSLYSENAYKHVRFILRSSNPNAEGDAAYADPNYSVQWTPEMFYERVWENLIETIKSL